MARNLGRSLLVGSVLIVLGLLLVPYSSYGRGMSNLGCERIGHSSDGTPHFDKRTFTDEGDELGPASVRSPGLENETRGSGPSSPPSPDLQPETVYLETWQTFPLYGGEMTSIAMGPLISDTAGWEMVYVGTRDAGVFKTLDGGRSWQTARTGLSFFPIRSLVIDPQQPNVLYAGTDYDGVWKSSDGAETWVQASDGLNQGLIVMSIAIDPQNSDTLYAGLAGGVGLGIGNIYKSEDGGASWELKDTGMPRASETSTYTNGVLTLAIHPDDPLQVYAGTNFEGAYHSSDGGESWSPINAGLPFLSGSTDHYQSVNALALDPHHGNRLSAIVGGRYYVFDGSQWQEINQGFYDANSGLFTDYLYFHPTDPDIIYSAGDRFGKSLDGGVTWTQHLGWDDSGHVPEIAFHPTFPDTIYAATDILMRYWGGVYKSSDQGESWTEISQGITAPPIQSVAIDPQDPGRIYAGTGGGHFYGSQDGGDTWHMGYQQLSPSQIEYDFGAISDLAVDPQDGHNLYLVGTNFYTSTDYGQTFEEVDAVEFPNCMAIASDAAGSIYVGASFGRGVYKSNDGGETWEQKNEGLPWFGSSICPILSIAVDPHDPETVWVGTQFSGGIVKSSDGGATWQSKGLTETNFVEAIAINPDDGAEMLAGGGFWDGGIYKSTDGGETWGVKLEGIAFVQDIVYDPRDPRKVYAATEGYGVLRSFDGGETWYNYSQGIFYPLSYSLDITAQDPALLVAGSYGSGLYWTYPSLANQPPNVPHDPWPADGAGDAPIDPVLRWAGGDPDGDRLTYTLAFGGQDPPPLVASSTITTYDPGPLDIDTSYYWQITASDGLSQTVGPIWSFTTVGSYSLYLPVVLRN